MIFKSIQENKLKIKEIFLNSSDIILYEFKTMSDSTSMVVYINGLIDKDSLNDRILKPLVDSLDSPRHISSIINITDIMEVYSMKDVISYITDGKVLLFNQDIEYAFVFNLSKYEKRQIQESTSEQVIRGPKEAFVEDIYINKTLLRRKIKNNKLVFEDYIFGEQTNTKVSIVYIDGIVNPTVLDELKKRLKKIKIDSLLDVHYIEEYIDDSPNSLVCTVLNTEKPDVLAAKILEGRIGILCDGSPNALSLPKIFIENIMTAEDYYLRPLYSTYIRFIRFLAFIISISLAGTYIALANFHQEMIPTPLLISMAGQREGVPLSAFSEAILMILVFEFLKEAGLRLPKPIGATVTLVGGLVIGQSAVDAGLVSGIMIIVVSLSGITEFVNPLLRELTVIYRFFLLILGGIFGLYGISCGFIIISFHLISIKSFGVPFLYPLAPHDKEGMKDFIRRNPLNQLNYRPKYIAKENSRKRSK